MIKKTLISLIITISLVSCTNSEKTNIITIDTHIDINVENFTDSINYTMNTDTKFNIPSMIEGGLDVAWLVVYTAQGELNEEGYTNAMDNAIAKFDDGQLYVNLCGWNTQTTKARLNALSGVSVHNVKGEPCLNGVPMPVNGWVKVPMESQFI